MTVKRFNNAYGEVDDDPLTSSAVTLTSGELSRMGAVDSANGELARITLDAVRQHGEPEIIHVTDYDGSATTATIERGKEGTSQREHPLGTAWEHGPTTADFTELDGGTP